LVDLLSLLVTEVRVLRAHLEVATGEKILTAEVEEVC